jgi:hypothetical protein
MYCSGTLGDTFMILLKLYNKGLKKVNHWCYNSKHYTVIQEIYSLIDIELNEISKEELGDNIVEGYIKPNETYTPFPKFNLPNIKHLKLPENYYVVSLQSGVDIKKHPWRFLTKDDITHIPSDKPIILLGTDNVDKSLLYGYDVLDLRNKTNILTSFSILANSNHYYGPQGLLGFFALSQKVNSTLWLKHPMEINGMNLRIGMIKEWEDYVTYIDKIKQK